MQIALYHYMQKVKNSNDMAYTNDELQAMANNPEVSPEEFHELWVNDFWVGAFKNLNERAKRERAQAQPSGRQESC